MPEMTECDDKQDIPYRGDEHILMIRFQTQIYDVNICYYIIDIYLYICT